ncbi:uncharacterized protein EI90DRAFT_3018223 [Cantharellus anzutake]|uniref:uncharacterized protein n=1 Tax=Cantharellus anzutake TaxID=1750568 RepID=UPI001908DB33|nr:uncharacterized protein EI90DRAFT_3018223 [Cantharellus anzutake]KAF8327137.1 hypothetical protein EI90DRAFT_3018223 [Cantharellus anzutake]
MTARITFLPASSLTTERSLTCLRDWHNPEGRAGEGIWHGPLAQGRNLTQGRPHDKWITSPSAFLVKSVTSLSIVEMADILSFNITQTLGSFKPRKMNDPDFPTKPKVNVASFGDFVDKRFKERIAAEEAAAAHATRLKAAAKTQSQSRMGIGGMMISDVNGYAKLVGIIKKVRHNGLSM